MKTEIMKMFLKANKTGSELYTMHGFDIRHDEPCNYYRRIYNDVVGWKKVSIIRIFCEYYPYSPSAESQLRS